MTALCNFEELIYNKDNDSDTTYIYHKTIEEVASFYQFRSVASCLEYQHQSRLKLRQLTLSAQILISGHHFCAAYPVKENANEVLLGASN